MLKKFDPIAVFNKKLLIWCFQKSFQLPIQTQIDNWYPKLDFWKKVPNKTIKTKSKAAFQSFTNILKMDAHCWKGRRPDKKKENSKSHREKKSKLADS